MFLNRRQIVIADHRPTERAASCLFGAGALLLLALGGMAGNRGLSGAGAMMAGSMIVARLATDYRSGISSSNWGTWRREQSRALFFCNLGFWTLIAGALMVLGLLVWGGIVGVPGYRADH